MADSVLDRTLVEVSGALSPLTTIDSATAATDLFFRLGYTLPGGQTFAALPAALIGDVDKIRTALVDFRIASSDNEKLSAAANLTYAIAKVSIAINELTNQLQGLPANFLSASKISELPRRLLDFLIMEHLETNYPGAYGSLLLIGFFDEVQLTTDPATFQSSTVLKKIWWERLPDFITKPKKIVQDTYQWETDFNSDLFLQRLYLVLQGFLLPGGLYEQNPDAKTAFGNVAEETWEIRMPLFQAGDTPEVYSQFGFIFSGAEASGGKPKGLALMPYVYGAAQFPFDLNEDYDIVLKLSTTIDNGVGIIVRPPLNFELLNNIFSSPASIGEFELELALQKKPGKQTETFLFGSANSTHLSIKNEVFKIFVVKKGTNPDFGIEVQVKEGKLVVGAENADGFLEKILSGIKIGLDFALAVGLTAKGGLYITGSSGLEILIPLHLQLGPLEIENIVLKLQPKDGAFPLIATSTFKVSIGPLLGVVENMGVILTLDFPPKGGNLGPANFGIGFKPPNGLGLSINAGAVIGGGYLFFDFEKEEYAGALELTIAGIVSAKAIGLITTKMPDGSKGFSMLIIITAEFNPPFQLSYGFTLIGVGGLLGLNRTVLLDPLREGVRNGAVNSIMFPQNVIANAPRIISDLKAIFPPYEGKFLIGPMAKLGWGTPTLISLSLGLIIEIPGNIAILGKLKIALPEESIAIVQIQVLFVGTIDFDKKMLTFDASLFESYVLTMTLEGDMAVRLKWGDIPDFILTVGGFHPSYTPPPLALPSLRRLAINILSTDIAKIRVECYQALTSNTYQFGAKAEVYFDLSACSINGHIGFDALFQFNPFHFIIELSASFSLSAAGIDVMSVRVRMSLEGPTPWHAKGTGSVSLLFFSISADFDKTWGDSKNTSLPDIAVLNKFLDEIAKREQWSAAVANTRNLLVSLRKFKETANPPLVLHPAGALIVQQKFLPLKIKLDKLGSQKINDVQKILITKAHSGGIELKVDDVDENFARAQFQSLSDADKLSKPSFEKMPGGVRITMAGLTVDNGKMVCKKVEYEITIIDKQPVKPLKKGRLFAQAGVLFAHFLKGNSASKSPLSKKTANELQPFMEKLQTVEEGYTVAFQADNKKMNNQSTFSSQAMAETYMNEEIAKNPSLKKDIHVVPNYELQPL